MTQINWREACKTKERDPNRKRRKYNDNRGEELKKYALEGWSIYVAAKKMGVTAITIDRWTEVYPEFAKFVREHYPRPKKWGR